MKNEVINSEKLLTSIKNAIIPPSLKDSLLKSLSKSFNHTNYNKNTYYYCDYTDHPTDYCETD